MDISMLTSFIVLWACLVGLLIHAIRNVWRLRKNDPRLFHAALALRREGQADDPLVAQVIQRHIHAQEVANAWLFGATAAIFGLVFSGLFAIHEWRWVQAAAAFRQTIAEHAQRAGAYDALKARVDAREMRFCRLFVDEGDYPEISAVLSYIEIGPRRPPPPTDGFDGWIEWSPEQETLLRFRPGTFEDVAAYKIDKVELRIVEPIDPRAQLKISCLEYDLTLVKDGKITEQCTGDEAADPSGATIVIQP